MYHAGSHDPLLGHLHVFCFFTIMTVEALASLMNDMPCNYNKDRSMPFRVKALFRGAQ